MHVRRDIDLHYPPHPEKVCASARYLPPTDHYRDDGTNLPDCRKNSCPSLPTDHYGGDGTYSETNTGATPTSHSQTALLLLRRIIPGATERLTRQRTKKTTRHPSTAETASPTTPLCSRRIIPGATERLRKTDTLVTFPSLDTSIQATALLRP